MNSVFINCYSPEIARYAASGLQPYAQATASGLQIPVSQITFGQMSIKTQSSKSAQVPIGKSESPDYTLAESIFKVNDGRTWVGLYYEKSGTWHFITKATDEWGFPCTPILNDPDARKAMSDQVCYKDDTVGQIRVDSNRRALP